MKTTAKVFVSTYKKYNEGSIEGSWLTLEDYEDKDEFFEYCADIHKDEGDPEFMFQDWEGIPEGMIGESWINPSVWEWLRLDEDEQEILEAYIYLFSPDFEEALEEYMDEYMGYWDSDEDFVQELLEETGSIPSDLHYYIHIDWQSTARDIMYDYSEYNGHYFRNI